MTQENPNQVTTLPAVGAPGQADLYQGIRALLLAARTQVRQTVNTAMVQTYWHIGRMIVEDEQGGQKRAAYGKQVLQELALKLSDEFGAGFDVSNLRNMRRFYQAFPIRETLSPELSWSAYLSLMRIENAQAREWYAQEAAQQNWSVRALDRQISTLYYERLLSTQDKAKAQVKDEAAQNINKEAAPPRKRQPDAGLDFVLRAQCSGGQVFAAGRQGPTVCQQIPSANAYRSRVASRVRARPGFVGNT
jgi:predicted nuclease of restriction endonuclease-like (RecB) superfamily